MEGVIDEHWRRNEASQYIKSQLYWTSCAYSYIGNSICHHQLAILRRKHTLTHHFKRVATTHFFYCEWGIIIITTMRWQEDLLYKGCASLIHFRSKCCPLLPTNQTHERIKEHSFFFFFYFFWSSTSTNIVIFYLYNLYVCVCVLIFSIANIYTYFFFFLVNQQPTTTTTLWVYAFDIYQINKKKRTATKSNQPPTTTKNKQQKIKSKPSSVQLHIKGNVIWLENF